MRLIILTAVSILVLTAWADQSPIPPADSRAGSLVADSTLPLTASGVVAGSSLDSIISTLSNQARTLAGTADTARKQGFTLPVGLMPAVTRALSANANDSAGELAAMRAALSTYNRELQILVTTPGFAGSTSIDRVAPAMPIAGGTATVNLTYTPGTDLGPGAAIMVASHWMDPWSLQTDDAGAGNYVSLSTGKGIEAQFTAASVSRKGINGGLYTGENLPVFELQSGSVQAGQSIRIHYSKLNLPVQAVQNFPLPIYVRTAADQPFLPAQQSDLTIEAAPLARMGVYAPSIVTTREPFRIALKFTDIYGNPATGNTPPLDVLVDGSVSTRVAAGSNVSPEVGLTIATPGIHRIQVSSAGGGFSGTARVQVEDHPAYLVRWVDLHAHTALSDALQSDAEIHHRLDGVLDDVFLIDDDDQLSSVDWSHRRTQALDGFVWNAGILSGGHHLVLSSAPLTFADSPRLEYPALADLVQGIHGPNALIVDLPEVPADVRFQNPKVTRLVEIKAGSGTFEWYGNEFARRGYRIGFTGSSTAHNHQLGPPSSTGRTAVMVEPGESLFDALRARRTWVTSGPRIMLAATVNGAYPGERVAAAADRIIKGTVIGTAGIDRIDLLRNGKVIDSRDLEGDTTAQTVKVSFFSSSAPVDGHDDLPRNGREWIGFVHVQGATIASVDGSAFHNPVRQAVAVNPADPARVDFITWTRGQPSSFSFDLDNNNDAAVLDMSLKSGFEDNGEVPRDRKPAAIPSLRLIVSMQELRQGSVTRHYDVDGYNDTVTFELVKKQLPDTADFAFTDERQFGEGDYYYVRVTQADDGMAWTSPVWVGGFDSP